MMNQILVAVLTIGAVLIVGGIIWDVIRGLTKYHEGHKQPSSNTLLNAFVKNSLIKQF